jgi:phage tail-like protein
MAAGKPKNFHKQHRFRVEVDGFTSAAFTTCSELSKALEVIEHREGGVLLPDKSPGTMTVDDVTLERGATSDKELYDWFDSVADSSVEGEYGLSEDDAVDYARTVDIVQLGNDGQPLVRFRLFRAWPNKISAGQWDNDSNEVRIEALTLVIHNWQRIPI